MASYLLMMIWKKEKLCPRVTHHRFVLYVVTVALTKIKHLCPNELSH